MKNRLSIVVMATLVVLAGLVWMVARSQRGALRTAAAVVPMVSVESPKTQAASAQPAQLEFPAVQTPPPPVVDHIDADGVQKHVAQSGETVSSLATDLLGKDSKTNRDAIINANSSLKADPDKLLAGKSYRIPSADEVAAAPTPVVASPAPQPQEEPVPAEPAKELKYTARTGDTVANMAGAFLGNTDEAHQAEIINANRSLRADPDRVVAGKSYRIPAPDGLSAAAATSTVVARPTTQPDADQVVVAGSPRTLRYTAQAGDTVTTLAVQLLGRDTEEARNAIIANNPSLKKNPDRVIAGQAYWIPAPVASIQGE